MTKDQILLLAIIAAALPMFFWRRLRHDMVALGTLLACVAAGLVPTAEAFSGFGHPAVITVACILVLSGGLQSTGAIDALTHLVIPRSAGPTVTIAALACLAALLSGFMNNVGALALLMPIAIQVAAGLQIPPGKVLMPLAFGSILGGMTTLIGTPPNLIVSGFRAEQSGAAFAMFDFTPVGLTVSVAGLAFLVLAGWRLVPSRNRAGTEGFATGAYLTEALIPEGSRTAGMTLREIEAVLEEVGAQVVGFIRNDVRMPASHSFRKMRTADILVIEAEPEALASILSSLDLRLAEDIPPQEQQGNPDLTTASARDSGGMSALSFDDTVLMELVVRPRAEIVTRTAASLHLRRRYGINLLAISRQGRRSTTRLRATSIKDGDVLLMQGPAEALLEFASHFGCVPLAERPIHIPDTKKALMASLVMAAAIGATASGVISAAVAFSAAVLAAVATGISSGRRIYGAVDWPVIVLLASLIPVAGAMASTGTADVIAGVLLDSIAQGHAVVALVLILLVTMFLSDFMNNAATAAMMCPIAIRTGEQLGTNTDPFLMAIAVGASCAFLTPIGHQNNMLIMGPGGFRFGDYWRLGLPLEILITAVAVPMIILVWPL